MLHNSYYEETYELVTIKKKPTCCLPAAAIGRDWSDGEDAARRSRRKRTRPESMAPSTSPGDDASAVLDSWRKTKSSLVESILD